MKKVQKTEFLQRMQELAERIREDVTPFPKNEMTDFARMQRKARAKDDALFFAETYFPHRVTSEFAPFHREMVEKSEIKNKIVVIAGFRGCAKSELIALVQALRWGLFGMRKNIGFVGENSELAAERTGDIKVELETNPRLIADFGDQSVLGAWEWEDFRIRAGCHYQAFGRKMRLRGGKSRGSRYDQWIFDDFEDPRTAYNIKMVEKGVNQVKQDAVGATNLIDWGVVFLGNYFSKTSVIHTLMEDDNTEKMTIRVFENGKVTWKRYTVEDLENLRKVLGSIIFDIEMMCFPRDDENKDFKEAWIKYWEEKDYRSKPRKRRIAFLDPSLRKGESNDFKAIVVLDGFYDPIEYNTVHAWIRHASVAEMVTEMYRVEKELKIECFGVEANDVKEYLQEILDRESQVRGYYLPIQWVDHTIAKETRIRPKSALVEQGKAKFLKNQGDQDILIAQLVKYPETGVNDDGPDAWAAGIDLLKAKMGDVTYESVKKGGLRGLFKKVGGW